VVDEVAGQQRSERLRGRHAVLAGERVDRVLLGVSGQHGGVVAGEVGGGEVAGERHAHVEVDQLVRVRAADLHDADLGLAVVVRTQHQLPR
jgi:hypothetical protein